MFLQSTQNELNSIFDKTLDKTKLFTYKLNHIYTFNFLQLHLVRNLKELETYEQLHVIYIVEVFSNCAFL